MISLTEQVNVCAVNQLIEDVEVPVCGRVPPRHATPLHQVWKQATNNIMRAFRASNTVRCSHLSQCGKRRSLTCGDAGSDGIALEVEGHLQVLALPTRIAISQGARSLQFTTVIQNKMAKEDRSTHCTYNGLTLQEELRPHHAFIPCVSSFEHDLHSFANLYSNLRSPK